MKVEPNAVVGMTQEMVLCRGGEVILHDGQATPVGRLEDAASPFARFCQSLDPNKCFIIAIVLDDVDMSVFLAARDAARQMGIHVQSPRDTRPNLEALWETYRQSRRFRSLSESPGAQ